MRRGSDISLQTPIPLPDDYFAKRDFKLALSRAGFANDSDPAGLLPCWLGTFVRKGSSQDIAQCEKCPPGNYPKMTFILDSSYFAISRPIVLCFIFQYVHQCCVTESTCYWDIDQLSVQVDDTNTLL